MYGTNIINFYYLVTVLYLGLKFDGHADIFAVSVSHFSEHPDCINGAMEHKDWLGKMFRHVRKSGEFDVVLLETRLVQNALAHDNRHIRQEKFHSAIGHSQVQHFIRLHISVDIAFQFFIEECHAVVAAIVVLAALFAITKSVAY